MDNLYCKYCNKYFRFKDLYDQHEITCEFIFRSRRRKDRESDYIETLPTVQEQFKLIQYLTLTVNRLENEVTRLKINAGTRKRKLVLDILNNNSTPKPCILFENWYKQFTIEQTDLNSVFEGDITDGMIKVLQKYLMRNHNTPICSFQQKDNSIYIWTTEFNNSEMNEPIWVLLDNIVYKKWLRCLNHQFLQRFLKWQVDNTALICSCEREKEKHISAMHKINGLEENYEKKRRGVLHKWIYTKLAREIEFNTDYV